MPKVRIIDDFLPDPARMRASALASGFGTWHPNKGDIGADAYSGVNFWGDHRQGFEALHGALGQIVPSSMFFRITNPKMERARIHSDREYGDFTAIIYLGPDVPDSGSGTAFYRHKERGLSELPPLESMMADPADFAALKADMERPEAWTVTEFVEAKFNRCIIFDAPLIHCRIPMNGYGESDADSRMVWVAHFARAEHA